MTGDLVYGEFDDAGTSLLALIEFMESFDIPWAPIFGNHDNESKKGADWQSARLEAAKNCLFKQRTLTGNGNYTVGIQQDGVLKRVFFMLDSNGCGAISEESRANGHTVTSVGFGKIRLIGTQKPRNPFVLYPLPLNFLLPSTFSRLFLKRSERRAIRSILDI